MKEATACTRIVNSIKDAGHTAFKIPDDSGGKGGFTRGKAYDITSTIFSYGLAIEVKLKPNLPAQWHTFYNSHTPVQKKLLTEHETAHPGQAFTFFVEFLHCLEYKKRKHKLWIAPWGETMKKIYKPKTWMLCGTKPYGKKKNPGYDLQEFFDMLLFTD